MKPSTIVPIHHEFLEEDVLSDLAKCMKEDPDTIKNLIVGGVYAVWRVISRSSFAGSTTATFLVQMDRNLLFIPALVGQGLDDWMSYLEQWFIDLAEQNNIKKIQFHGRRGWMKEAKSRGWDCDRMIFVKEVC